MKAHTGYVKTYTPGLRSGSVEVNIDGAWTSLPFTSTDIVGEDVRSGDKVKVQFQPNARSKAKSTKRKIAAIKLDPDSPSRDRRDTPVAGLSSEDELFTVPVDPEGGTAARFTKQRYVQSGSRLDFD